MSNEPDEQITLAERVAHEVMHSLGFREPHEHSKWADIVQDVQEHLEYEIDSQVSVAFGRERIVSGPGFAEFFHYEFVNSWLAKLTTDTIIGSFIAGVLYNRVARKIARYQTAIIKDMEDDEDEAIEEATDVSGITMDDAASSGSAG